MKGTIMKRLFATVAVLLTVIAFPALALSLEEAKSQGLVGERLDGYISAVSSNPSAEVTRLVSEVNAKRKEAYAQIAAKNGQPVAVVEKLAAAKLVERAERGHYYMDVGGNWKRK